LPEAHESEMSVRNPILARFFLRGQSQEYGFSPVWKRSCSLRVDMRVKLLLHLAYLQENANGCFREALSMISESDSKRLRWGTKFVQMRVLKRARRGNNVADFLGTYPSQSSYTKTHKQDEKLIDG
jgi:hypothetical protein